MYPQGVAGLLTACCWANIGSIAVGIVSRLYLCLYSVAIKESRAELKRRWTTPAAQDLRTAIQQRLRGRDGLDGLGLHEVGGRADLRYFPAATALSPLKDVVWRGIDFTGSSLGNLEFHDSLVEDCVFDAADCQFWQPLRTAFSRCAFVKADLRRSTLGEWAGGANTFTGIDFTSARLTYSTTSAATYVDCDFSFANLQRINFWQSSLIRCKFAGPLKDVVFDGRLLGEAKPEANPMREIDMSDAILSECEFRGLDLASVTLPDDPSLMLIKDSDVVARAMRALSTSSDPRVPVAILMLEHAAELLSFGGVALLNGHDFEDAADVVEGALRAAGWEPYKQ
jgi:uncharacterized protein YjbI with pentapeptide repeats